MKYECISELKTFFSENIVLYTIVIKKNKIQKPVSRSYIVFSKFYLLLCFLTVKSDTQYFMHLG